MSGMGRFALAATALALLCAPGRAQMNTLWPPPGVAVAPDYGHDQAHPTALPDGHGGVFLVWTQFADYSGSKGWVGADIRAQRLDADGNRLWGDRGVAVCAATGDQIHPVATLDGAGGIVVAWEDERNSSSDIYAQRLDANGAPAWAANGVAVTRASADQVNPEICPDGQGGAFVTWEDFRAGKFNEDIYTRKIGADGTLAGTADTPIANTGDTEFWPRIAQDGAGGALVAYTNKIKVSNNVFTVDVLATRLNASGAASGSVTVCDAPNDQILNDIQPDGAGGFLLAWWDLRNGAGNGDIFCQRLDASLAPLWGANGRAVDTRPTDAYLPTILVSPQGILVFYFETGQKDDLRAARLDLDGSVLWSAASLSTDTDKQVYPVGAPDGAGGAYVAWEDYRNNLDGEQPDVYIQHLTGSGAGAWGEGGVPLAATDAYEDQPTIAPDGAGGAVAAWEDWTDIGGGQAMALRLNDLTPPDTTPPTAAISLPADGALVRGVVTVTGTADDPAFGSATLAFGAGTAPSSFTTLSTLTAPVTDGDLGAWDTSALGTGTYTLRLTARDANFNEAAATRAVTVVHAGDLDGDAVASWSDVRRVLDIVAGLDAATPVDTAAGDVWPAASETAAAGDGTLDILDVARLARAAAGLDALP